MSKPSGVSTAVTAQALPYSSCVCAGMAISPASSPSSSNYALPLSDKAAVRHARQRKRQHAQQRSQQSQAPFCSHLHVPSSVPLARQPRNFFSVMLRAPHGMIGSQRSARHPRGKEVLPMKAKRCTNPSCRREFKPSARCPYCGKEYPRLVSTADRHHALCGDPDLLRQPQDSGHPGDPGAHASVPPGHEGSDRAHAQSDRKGLSSLRGQGAEG